MEKIEGIWDYLKQPREVAIFSHRNPDGDAIGSSLGLQHFLEKFGHKVHVFVPSDFPESLEFLPKSDEVMIWDKQEEKCKELLKGKQVFFFLDFNALNRIDKMGDFVQALTWEKSVLIGHHLYPDDFTDYGISETAASSTCELVHECIRRWGALDHLDKTIGTCLYTGIVTDTGSFRHATNPRLFSIVSELVAVGVDDTYVQDQIFNSLSEKNLRLLGHCLANRMHYWPEYRTAMIWLSKKDYDHFEIQRGDTEGIVNYMLSIKDVKLAAFIHNQPTVVKISMRSKGDFDVQEICSKYWKGGGHRNASGAHSYQSLKKTIEKFKAILPEYQAELLK